MLIDYPDVPPSVGRFEAKAFDPLKWKPEYPNPAFDNMRPDDAFWAARIVSRFTDEMIGAVVQKAQYSDPRATRVHDADVDRAPRQGRRRRGSIRSARSSTRCSPPTARFTFTNAAVAARAAASGRELSASVVSLRQRDRHAHAGRRARKRSPRPSGRAPAGLLDSGEYVGVEITAVHPAAPRMGATGGVLLPPRRPRAGRWSASSAVDLEKRLERPQ